ncbi:TM0106 family RecB-like putative nuclease [Micrococcus flavus]|uniref:Uncharacterized protein n=1 Tax=Micrococcus flavus TaxID=384602 RepID=A0A4Y8X2L2_9MICC|nr:bifunctional RecB family nuclease/DEAD/DEAH box helicase [Micrococcus flavus]MBB4881831.1 uncharacterized protein [Micrococcus flavus]TFI03618.1 TM0106 family RecB-like putative nuclease [Micrococcus flavus]GGK45188.1 ATPase [Micrococcus flavus]
MVSFAPDLRSFLLSPSDVTAAATCEYGWYRLKVDPALGRAPQPVDEDPFLTRVSGLGDEHEARVLAGLTAEHGAERVAVLERPSHWIPEEIAAARDRTAAALEGRPAVVFQAMLHDGTFGGLADFLVLRRDAGHPEGAYEVVDTKLARHARVTALLQIAAYADLLDGMGVPRTRTGSLWLGDHTRHEVDLTDVIPVYRHQRARLERDLRAHVDAGRAASWDDGLAVCGACPACEEAITAHRDVLLTAGATRLQRTRLREAGIRTVEDLAASEQTPPGISERTWRGLRDQAVLQLTPQRPDGTPEFRIVDPEPIRSLPAPSAGDLFFDFEGDPLWTAPSGAMEGLEYLWGWVKAPDGDTAGTAFEDFRFTGLWADSRAQERAALEEFVRCVEARRAEHPDMRIYHYAAYEVTALKRLTVRHGVGEAELDDWLRAGLFVDLYATVRASLRAAVESYSIKKLEPLYMGADHRSEDGVTTAADSVTEYHAYAAAGDADEARRLRAGIEDYNRYDCVSTARLRDWLRAQVDGEAEPADGADASAEVDADPLTAESAPSAREEDITRAGAVLSLLPEECREAGAVLDADQRALAMLAAALEYFPRENKPLWWAMFDRAVSAPDEWQEPRANLVFDAVEQVSEWEKPPGKGNPLRELTVTGRLEPGTEIRPRERKSDQFKLQALYDDPPAWAVLQPNAVRWQSKSPLDAVEVEGIGGERFRVRLLQRQSVKYESQHAEVPMGVFHLNYVSPGAILDRIREEAEAAASTASLPGGAVSDLLARRDPSAVGRSVRDISNDVRSGALDGVTGLVEALGSAQGSYVAVQGPPGTGKTHVGSHAVKALLERGWSVGVTAQSHAVVENFLDKLVQIGVEPERVGKKPKDPSAEHSWTALGDKEDLDFAGPGRVVGGTSWLFSHADVSPVDLLVVDEAGQLSLAYLLGAGSSARTILLLGDPQQLPQVQKGEHPQPIGEAALTWIAEGHAVLPGERGFFLDTSWRMHSALTRAVSDLSYAGQLRSREDVTDARRLGGIAPGLHPRPVEHTGNAVSSEKEAKRVVELVRDVVGRSWTDPQDGDSPRALTPEDVIVVAPYNAQVATVRTALDDAGFTATTVGTVDKFQGREAPVAILTMAASSPQEVPRGLDFLLNRNRLNVSISRGKWACYLVHSPALADALPANPADLPMIGAFLRLVHR